MKNRMACLFLLLTLALASRGMAESEIVLTFGGDCVLGTREEWQKDDETFLTRIDQSGFDWCFANLQDVFAQDDMTLVNLEGVLQDSGKGLVKDKQYRFRGPTAYTEILTASSIEQVNIANNHYIDYGKAGRESTRKALEEAGLPFSGYEYLHVMERDGYKIGFGGCRETIYRQKKTIIQDDIAKLKEQGCDVIIYSCHWGEEYSPKHNARQQKMAQYAIDCGANIIVGTHPHCVQGIERRSGAVILYSLGNLMFGGTHEMRTFDGLVVQATLRFDSDGYQGVEMKLLPVLTSSDIPNNNFRPAWAEGEDFKRILKLVQKDSKMDIKETMCFPVKKQ